MCFKMAPCPNDFQDGALPARMPREAMGGHGRLRETTGGHGMPRDATGGHGRPRVREVATGGHGKPREATGGHGRPREAAGSRPE